MTDWKRAHISTHMVLATAALPFNTRFPLPELIAEMTGAPLGVCYAAVEREDDRGNLDYGTSLRGAWITEKGREVLAKTTIPAPPGAAS